jgi:hypothetical protein
MYNESSSDVIYETGSLFGMIDDTYVSNITKEKYMDTLHFSFRIITRADMVNMLGRVKDFNVDEKQTLAEWLKAQQIHLMILWKAPPSFEDVAMLSGPTKYTNSIMALQEITHWLHIETEVDYEPSQLRVKWRRKQMGSEMASMLVLSTDPSISDKVTATLTKKSKDCERMAYNETYDYRFFAPSADIDEKSYNAGIKAQLHYISQRRCAEIKGIKYDLFNYTPKREGKWADEETVCDKLLDKDKKLFTMSGISHTTPFTKIYCTGTCWVFSWLIEDEETAKFFLDFEFQKQLSIWVENNDLAITITYPFNQDCASESIQEPASETGFGYDDSKETTDEFGRVSQETIKKAASKKSDTMITALTSQSTEREMTSTASSSLTASTIQPPNHGGRTQPPNVPNPYALSDSGQLMNIQQFTQLQKVVERQTSTSISSHFNTVLAFHDPDRGIKQLIAEEIRKAIRVEMTINRNLNQLDCGSAHMPKE